MSTRHKASQSQARLEVGGKQIVDISKLLVDHKSKNTHLSGTSIVQLNGTLSPLRIIAQLVPSKVKGTVTEITDVFGFVIEPFGITVDNSGNGEKGKHLQKDVLAILGGKKVIECLQTGRDISSTGESDSGGGDQVSGDGKHGNTSVGDFVFSEKVEFFLRTVFDESKRIEKTKL